jgi:hypothetical protein
MVVFAAEAANAPCLHDEFISRLRIGASLRSTGKVDCRTCLTRSRRFWLMPLDGHIATSGATRRRGQAAPLVHP